ncbi:MAG: amino acid transporter permease [Microbacteriaceae bacterium]|nr:amino acid transporter permease [Microbacteriaceae bacterium]
MTILISGLSVGAIYALIAIGYNITYLAAGVINFAFANFVMLGVFAWLVVTGFSLPSVIGLVVTIAIFAVLGVIEERVAIRPLPIGRHAELITTLGVGTVLTGLITVIWGTNPLPVKPVVDGGFQFLGAIVTWNDVLLVGAASVAAVVLYFVLRHTRLGLAATALNQDRTAAILRGVDSRRIAVIAFAFALGYAALIAPVVGNQTFADVGAPLTLAIKGFFALTIGGIGSNLGALVGGFAVGIIEALAARYVGGEFQDLFVFVLFLLFVFLRPSGIIGQRALRTV